MPLHFQHECVVCTFLGVLYVGCRCAKCQEWKVLGRDWGQLEAVRNVLWVNVKGDRPQIILYALGKLPGWGLPTQKEMKKIAQKSRVLGLGLPHLPEQQQQDY